MTTRAEREAASRERLYSQFGIIDKTPEFNQQQSAKLLALVDIEKARIRKAYGSTEQASLAMSLVDLDQLAAKIRYHTVDKPDD